MNHHDDVFVEERFAETKGLNSVRAMLCAAGGSLIFLFVRVCGVFF